MFTSEPSLTQRIERLIGDVPVLDARTNLDVRRPKARDLAALLAEPPILQALRSVGFRGDPVDPARGVADRVAEAIPFLAQVRNTSAAWCFFRIARDLYDFIEPDLTPANAGELIDRVARSAEDASWADHVLRKRMRLERLIAPIPPATDEPVAADALDPALVGFRLDLAAGDPGDADPTLIRREVFDRLDAQIEAPIHFAALAEPLSPANPIHAAILDWHQIHQAPLQVIVGRGEADVGDEAEIDEAIQRHPGIRFGLLTSGTKTRSWAEALAGRSANVLIGSLGDLGSRPAILEEQVTTRIESLGATRIGGFASGAATVEGIYGTFQLCRKATAAALARTVAGGYFEEDEVAPILRAILRTAPQRWYGLAD